MSKKAKIKELTAEQILELIKERQKINQKLDSQPKRSKEYREYRDLQVEILEKRQQWHQIKCDLTELDAMLQGSYPPHYAYWWEKEILDAWNNIQTDEQQYDQVESLRDILKQKRMGDIIRKRQPKTHKALREAKHLKQVIKDYNDQWPEQDEE